MKDLHFDPGPVDGVFDQDTQYAVIAVQKYFGLPRTGVIDTGGADCALTHFTYSPASRRASPTASRSTSTVRCSPLFQNWQPILLTTTSTGSGEHFCGGVDGCQYAITPTGHFHFYDLAQGLAEGQARHDVEPVLLQRGRSRCTGSQSVPAYPASHGCARIPMHIADYFYTLVHQGESVFVVGTPKKVGNGYVGPVKTPPTTPKTTPPATVGSAATPTTVKHTPTTGKSTPTTVKHTTSTTKPKSKP